MNVRDTASVTVSTPVSGKRRRRSYPTRVTAQATTTHYVKVDPQVMAAAKEAIRPGQKIVIVSSTTVRLVNDTE